MSSTFRICVQIFKETCWLWSYSTRRGGSAGGFDFGIVAEVSSGCVSSCPALVSSPASGDAGARSANASASLRKFHAVSTSGLISRSLAVTAMDVASYTFSRRRRIASSCNARMSFTFGSEASRRACGRGRVMRRRREGARSVEARRRQGTASDVENEHRGPVAERRVLDVDERRDTPWTPRGSRVCGRASRRRRDPRPCGTISSIVAHDI